MSSDDIRRSLARVCRCVGCGAAETDPIVVADNLSVSLLSLVSNTLSLL